MLIRPQTCIFCSRALTIAFVLIAVPLTYLCVLGISETGLDLNSAPSTTLLGRTRSIGLEYFQSQISRDPLYFVITSRPSGRYIIDNYTKAFMIYQRDALGASRFGQFVTVHQDVFSKGFPQSGMRFLLGGADNDTTVIKIDTNITSRRERAAFLRYLESWIQDFSFDNEFQQHVWKRHYDVRVTGMSAMAHDLAISLWRDVAVLLATSLPLAWLALVVGFWIYSHRVSGVFHGVSSCNRRARRSNQVRGMGDASHTDDEENLVVDGDGTVRKQWVPSAVEILQSRQANRRHRLPAVRAATFCVIVVLLSLPWTFLNIWTLAPFYLISPFSPLLLVLIGPLISLVCASSVYSCIWFVATSAVVEQQTHDSLMEVDTIVSLLCPDHPATPLGETPSSPMRTVRSSTSRSGVSGSDDQRASFSRAQLLSEGSTLFFLETPLFCGLHVGLSNADVLPHCSGALPVLEAQVEVNRSVWQLLSIRCVVEAVRGFHSAALLTLTGTFTFFIALYFIPVSYLSTSGLSAAVGVFFNISFNLKVTMVIAIAHFNSFFASTLNDGGPQKPRDEGQYLGRNTSQISIASAVATGEGQGLLQNISLGRARASVSETSGTGSVANYSTSAHSESLSSDEHARHCFSRPFSRFLLRFLRLVVAYDSLQSFLLTSVSVAGFAANVAIISISCLIAAGTGYSLMTADGNESMYDQLPTRGAYVEANTILRHAINPALLHPANVVFQAPELGGVLHPNFWNNVTVSVPSVAEFLGLPLSNITSVTRIYGVDISSLDAVLLLSDDSYRYLWKMNVDETATLLQISLYPLTDPMEQQADPMIRLMRPLCDALYSNGSASFAFVGWYGANGASWESMHTALPQMALLFGIAVCSVVIVLAVVFFFFTTRRTQDAFELLINRLSQASARRKRRRWRLRILSMSIRAAVIAAFVSVFVGTAALAAATEAFKFRVAHDHMTRTDVHSSGITWTVYPLCLPVVCAIALIVAVVYLDEVLVHSANGHVLLMAADVRAIVGAASASGNAPAATSPHLNDERAPLMESCDVRFVAAADSAHHPLVSSLSSLTSDLPTSKRSWDHLTRVSASFLLMESVHASSADARRTKWSNEHATTGAIIKRLSGLSQNSAGERSGDSSEEALEDGRVSQEEFCSRWLAAATVEYVKQAILCDGIAATEPQTSPLMTPWITFTVILGFTGGCATLLLSDTQMIIEVGVVLTVSGFLLAGFVVPFMLPVMRRIAVLA